MLRNPLFCTILILILLVPGCVSHSDFNVETGITPKVILIIGDGMDDQQITIARNYLFGSQGQLTLDSMPYRGSVQVQALNEDNPSQAIYVADSANTATTIAGGVNTSRGRIGTTAHTDEDIVNIMEMASAANMGTGIVTTASVTDATPASFAAHINQRWCQQPSDMVKENTEFPQSSTDCSADYKVNGGLGSISEQIAASQVDIILGGGADYFTELIEGSLDTTVLDAARSNGFSVIQVRSELTNLISKQKILGLFSPGTMPVQYRGVDGGEAHFIVRENGEVKWPEPFGCEVNPDFDDVPTLADMTRTALKHLNDYEGFMLMIESASIDKQSHYRRPCGQIGEVRQLDEAVKIALEYGARHPETLILVTADHGHTAHIIAETSGLAPQNYASPGHFARVRTLQGSIMGVNYASNDSPLWDEHSGVQVPVFASGPGVKSLPTYIRQAEIFHILANYLGLSETLSTD
jgi:alkaline phosphatase